MSKVLLLTDGLANRGVIDHGEMVATASRLRPEGILTSSFGVGADFDEQLLSRLATEGGDLVADQELVLIVAIAFKGAHPEGAERGVQCRVSDRNHVFFAEPVPVTWRSVAAVEDTTQPVNRDVRLAVAAMLAERARSTALAANRRGDFNAAKRILREMVDDLRAMAPGDKGVLALIDQLHHDAVAFAELMSPTAMKARHFASYRIAHSREEGGTARRKKRPEE